MTLTEFLTARLDEDEAWARGQQEARRAQALAARSAFGVSHLVVGDRLNPARALAEVAAKRAIVALHEPFEPYGGLGWKCETCAENSEADYDGSPMIEWPCMTVRYLASVYVDHPDYRDEWKP